MIHLGKTEMKPLSYIKKDYQIKSLSFLSLKLTLLIHNLH